MIAQVLANIAESEMTNEQVQAEKTEENTSSTVLEEPQAPVSNAQPLSQWLLPDEYLPSQTPGKEIMLHPSVPRATRPSKYKSSPFVTDFGIYLLFNLLVCFFNTQLLMFKDQIHR